jgi:hypothetical protein
VLVWVALACAPGCFGTFRLTSTVYAFNEGVSKHAAVRELLFVGFLVVPVYPLAAVVDGTVLNTIEFATGENPVDTADGRTVSVRRDPDGSVLLEVSGEKARRILARGRSLVLVEDGHEIARVDPQDDGGLRVEVDGVVRWVGADTVAALEGLEGAALAEAIAGTW